MRSTLLFFSLILLTPAETHAQPAAQTATVQPSIMVMPFTREGQDLRTVLEDDPDLGIAVTTIQRAFDQRGFTTVDARGAIKSVSRRSTFSIDNQESLKQAVIQNAGSDIYVEARLTVEANGRGRAATVQLNGIDSATGGALSNDICRSRHFRTNDVGRLTERALENCLDNFLDVLNSKFSQIGDAGRSLIIDVQFAPNSPLDMYVEVGTYDDPLADALVEWFDLNAHQNNYRIAGSGDTNLLLHDFRIPLRDAETGRNYRPRHLARDLRRFLVRELGIDANVDTQGNTILVTIEGWR